jgi:hypothetical protein
MDKRHGQSTGSKGKSKANADSKNSKSKSKFLQNFYKF